MPWRHKSTKSIVTEKNMEIMIKAGVPRDEFEHVFDELEAVAKMARRRGAIDKDEEQ